MKYARHLIFENKPRRLPLTLFVLLSVVIHFSLALLHKQEKPEEKPAGPQSNSPASEALYLHCEIISRGTTLSDILTGFGFSGADIHRMKEDIKPVYDLSLLKAGQELRIKKRENGDFVCLEYDIDDEEFLHIKKEGNEYTARKENIPYGVQLSLIRGIIADNLIASVYRQGEGEHLALTLADIFSWDIDFYTDLREGDRFSILFEKKYLRGEFCGYGKVLAAFFTNQGKTFQAYRYTYPDGSDWDYFDEQGRSLRKEFLKSPIKFARITSRFSLRRLHPIRKVYRPHYGVDYGARVGTPVQATADGTVIFAGRKGPAGRMIGVRHRNDYTTQYLHLRRFASGIKKGARVKGGQVIGYVGASGEATGPHLDYRIKYHGKYINPLTWKFKPVKPLPEKCRSDFIKTAGKCFFWMRTAAYFQSTNPIRLLPF